MNLKEKKVLFIDLDGTLLDTRNENTVYPSKENIKALERANKAGIKTIISTGRSGNGVKLYLDLFKPKFAVLGNGALIYKNGEIIEEKRFSKRQVIQIIEFAKANSLTIKVDDSQTCYGSESWICQKISSKLSLQNVRGYYLSSQKPYYKFVMWGKIKKSAMKQLADELKLKVSDISVVTSAKGYTIEVTHKDATKGKGNYYVAKKLLRLKNMDQVAHIGDSMNDSTAAEKMDLIAMKNSPKSLKELAAHVGPHYKKGGIAKLIDQMLKKEEEY